MTVDDEVSTTLGTGRVATIHSPNGRGVAAVEVTVDGAVQTIYVEVVE